MRNMLIVGADGQLGVEAELYFRNAYLCTPLTFAQLDITSSEAVRAAFVRYRPDICLNCAAVTNVDAAEGELADAAFRVNRDGASILAMVCAELSCVLVHISTDYVFDGQKDGDYTEADTPNPQGVYGQSKLEGERAVADSACKHFILRTAWLYGHHGGTNFVKTMLRLGRERGEVSVVTDQRGNPTTTLELCRIIGALLRTEQYGLYHATCEGVCTWNDFAKEIFRVYGLAVTVNDTTSAEFIRPAKRPANSGLSKQKLTKTAGYTPNGWQTCLREYAEKDARL